MLQYGSQRQHIFRAIWQLLWPRLLLPQLGQDQGIALLRSHRVLLGHILRNRPFLLRVGSTRPINAL
jgi:hypothetical protein